MPELLTPSYKLAVVLGVVGLCGIFNGLLQGSLLDEAALLPLAVTQAVVAGSAASGPVQIHVPYTMAPLII